MKRREFLKAIGAMSGAVALGTIGGCRSEYSEPFPDLPENSVSLPKNGKSVVIIGGGVAGLQAGCELVDRGFEVTVLERNALPGGKLKTWRDREFGLQKMPPSFHGWPIEHGIHGVWGFYKNFREFLHRHQIPLTKKKLGSYSYAFPDGKVEDLTAPTLPPPLHARQMFASVKRIPKGERAAGLHRFYKIGAFDTLNKREVDEADSLSFAEWAAHQKISKAFVQGYIDPICNMAAFKNIESTSALGVMRMLSGTLGSREDVEVHAYQDPPGETFLQPLLKYILQRGGKVKLGRKVSALTTEKKKITEAIVEGSQGKRVYRCGVCGIELSIHPDRCPLTQAPGKFIKQVHKNRESYRADFFISALDITGTQQLFKGEPFQQFPYFQKIQRLPKTAVTVVLLWYENSHAWQEVAGDRIVLFHSGFRLVDVTVNHSLLKDKTYRNRNAEVIEAQIGHKDVIRSLTNEAIVKAVHKELKLLFKGLPKPRDYRVMRWTAPWVSYSSFDVGTEKLRPNIPSPFENLFLIGDWVKLKTNCIFTEKTNVTAKIAVNLLLRKIGSSAGKITILKSETPNFWVNALRRFGSIS